MTIDGRLKIYTDSVCTPRAGGSCAASSGTSTQNYPLVFDPALVWESDTAGVTETLTVSFSENKTISALWIIGHNLKDFTITYGSGADDFIVTDGLLGAALSGIDISDNEITTSYFEFESVTTDRITITATAAFDNAMKKTIQLISCAEIVGEFSNAGKANVKVSFSPNNKRLQTITNKTAVIRGLDSVAITAAISFTSDQNDQWLSEWIYANPRPVLVWPCGGLYGEPFTHEVKGFRLEDLYRVYADGQLIPEFNSWWGGGVKMNLNFIEAY